MTKSLAASTAEDTAAAVENHPAMRAMVKTGLVAYGLVHLLVGMDRPAGGLGRRPGAGGPARRTRPAGQDPGRHAAVVGTGRRPSGPQPAALSGPAPRWYREHRR